MKMLVCIDGSDQSQKALNKAIEIATGCGVHDVSLLHVDESVRDITYPTGENIQRTESMRAKIHKKQNEMMKEAAAKFEEHGIKVEALLKEGHPSQTISKTANEGNFDMVILGSRGLGGLQKVFLGSVSNAVIQETKASVLVVK